MTVPAEILLSFIEQTGANPMYLISGEGPKFRRPSDERLLSELTPVELIRRGLEKLERANHDVKLVAPQNLPAEVASDFAAVGLFPLEAIGRSIPDPSEVQGYILAYRQWLPNPSSTIGVRILDDAMHPILTAGSIAAIDCSQTDPVALHGRIVAAAPEGKPIIRWLEVSGRHVILRPNQTSREFPIVPVNLDEAGSSLVIGQVVWSWSRFSED